MKDKKKIEPQLVSVKDGSIILGMSRCSLKNRIDAGEIPVVILPGARKKLISLDDIDNYIEKHKTTNYAKVKKPMPGEYRKKDSTQTLCRIV